MVFQILISLHFIPAIGYERLNKIYLCMFYQIKKNNQTNKTKTKKENKIYFVFLNGITFLSYSQPCSWKDQ